MSYKIRPIVFWAARLAFILILLGIGIKLTSYLRSPSHTIKDAGKVPQQQIQSRLSSDLNAANDQSVVSDTTQLINGSQSGSYSVNKNTLAFYYLDQASALSNLKQYTQAIQDYQTAMALDSNIQGAALQGEVEAGYQNGERAQLIPLLEKLVSITSSKGYDTINGSPEEYQYDIQAIQNNQPANL